MKATQPRQGADAGAWTREDYYDEDDALAFQYYTTDSMRERIDQTDNLSDYDKMVIQHLAMRRWHIPGYSYWEDYRSWLGNNHPFLCFCMANPLHPFGKRERIVNLAASLAFGLAAASGVVLYYFYENEDMNEVVFSAYGFDISQGMISLMIIGGPIHVAFDLGVWFLQACPPCRTGGVLTSHLPESQQKCCLWIGAHVAIEITILSLALTVYVVILRASVEDDGDIDGVSTGIDDYAFIASYLMEVLVVNFIMFPLCTFTVFSGVLGCGRIPGIGGRPYQVRKWKRMQAQKKQKGAKTANPPSNQYPPGSASV